MPINNRGVIVFDGDDTLWETQELYNIAKSDFAGLLHGAGFPEERIIEQLDCLDSWRVDVVGFSKSRFFESMLITYAFLCERYNRIWDNATEDAIRDLGFRIFSKPVLFEDTISVLTALRQYYELILLTNGDLEVQEEKVHQLGEVFKELFSEIHICEIKDESEYRRIIEDHRNQSIWVIGNSVRSDINPALSLGLNAILIPHETWQYEQAIPAAGDYSTARSLTDAAQLILREDAKW